MKMRETREPPLPCLLLPMTHPPRPPKLPGSKRSSTTTGSRHAASNQWQQEVRRNAAGMGSGTDTAAATTTVKEAFSRREVETDRETRTRPDERKTRRLPLRLLVVAEGVQVMVLAAFLRPR